jgi:NADPH2:quinone reductase
MVHGIRVHSVGGPDRLVWEEIQVGEPGPGEVRIKQHAAGLNFIDVYHRTGLYKLSSLPAVIGMEGAGEVAALGAGVTSFKIGDRVAYQGVLGGYAEERLIAADRLVKLPDAISYETAAAVMLQGMTVRALLRDVYNVGPGTTLLFHAAAGGVGLIACQWAKALGATLIGTVSTDEKAELARANGATHVIVTSRENFVERVRELTGGEGCDVVYDSIGKDTYPGSLECLRPRGLFVSFGNASGPVPPFELTLLRGSLFVARPSVMAYTATPKELQENAADLFSMIASGAINVSVNQTFPLREAARAHELLESRRTTGSTVFTI